VKTKPKVISIYSGAGGLDLGFNKAGYKILYATDYWAPACNTLKKNNHTEIIECKDIRDVDYKKILNKLRLKNIDCLIGGPPCPAYSKSRFYLTEKKRAMDDVNAFTLKEYFRAINELQPKVFLFENVHGFVYKPHMAAFEYLKNTSRKLGYRINHKVINTADYGIPQTRERFFCVGIKRELKKEFCFPKETHCNPKTIKRSIDKRKPWVTCREAIGNLDYKLPEDKLMQAGSKHKDLLKKIPPGDNYLYFTEQRGHSNPIFKWRSRYWSFLLKLSPERPSWTIQASHSNNMGPFHWRNRFLRIGEIKRIQTFDDSYEITGDYKTQWRQIGNAVPPAMVKILAKEIKRQLLQ